MGPPGSGRTTLARQWVSELDGPTQVVYVRMPTDIDLDAYSPPSPFGAALADFMNAVNVSEGEIDEDHVQHLINHVGGLSDQYPARVVLDDLEILDLRAMERIMPLLGEAVGNYTGGQFLLVGRAFSTPIMSGLRSLGKTRVITAHTLALDESESTSAHELGLFGALNRDEVQIARVENGGWIAGMLNARPGNSSPALTDEKFDDLVLNEIVQPLPTSLQYVLTLAAYVPSMSVQLWEFMVEQAGMESRSGGRLLSQIPVVNSGKKFGLARSLRASLVRLTNLLVESDKFRQFVIQILEWYVRQDDFTSALQLADKHRLEADYLRLVKPLAIVRAKAENWQSIADMVNPLPNNTIATDPDITFWYTYALTESGRWSEMIDIHYLVIESWSQSESGLIRGRNHLMKGWVERGRGNYQTALIEFEKAYHTLPKNAHQERMYASASAETSVSHIRLGTSDIDWSNRTAFELSHLPPNQRWWNGNMGPLSLGYIASSGKLENAYQLAKQQIAGLDNLHPELTWRYQLLIAAIETERMHFDSASAAIEKARPYIHSDLQQNMTTVQESSLMAAQGNYEASMAHLDLEPFTAGRSVNNEFRFKSNLARQALDSGDVSTAELILDISAWPVDPWPRNFGDPHPQLILARIRAESGEFEEGVALAQAILKDAQYRRNRYLQIRCYAVLAAIYHEKGDHVLRNQEVSTAIAVDDGAGFQLAFFVKGQDVRSLDSTTASLDISSDSTVTPEPHSDSVTRLSILTQRELEVLSHVANGLSNKEIGEIMFISVSTVKNHMANIFAKFVVSNRRVAVSRAKTLGILDL